MTDYTQSLAAVTEDASKAAERLAQRRKLEIQIMDLSGDKAGAVAAQRADELAAMDASLRPLQQRLYALQDEAALLAANKASAEAAYSTLQRSVEAQKNVLQTAYKTASDAVKALIDSTGASISKLSSLSAALKSSLGGMKAPGMEALDRRAAQAQLQTALTIARAGGPLPGADSLQSALTAVAQPSAALFGSFEDYQRDFYDTALTIGDLSSMTDNALSIDQRTLDTLKSQSDILDQTYAAEVARLDKLLDWGKAQVDVMNKVDASVLEVGQAVGALAAALSNAGVQSQMPGFAAGGAHEGGWRIVGENGPEAEYTGPSHISTNSQTRDMLDNAGVEARLDEMNRTLKYALFQIAKNTGETADKLDDFDRNGMPKPREEIV